MHGVIDLLSLPQFKARVAGGVVVGGSQTMLIETETKISELAITQVESRIEKIK